MLYKTDFRKALYFVPVESKEFRSNYFSLDFSKEKKFMQMKAFLENSKNRVFFSLEKKCVILHKKQKITFNCLVVLGINNEIWLIPQEYLIPIL